MDAKELMIGDWYNIGTKDITVYKQVDRYFYTETCTHEWMQPIPLTAEILEKNLFVKDGYTNLSPDYVYNSTGICVCVNLRTTCDKRIIISVITCADMTKKEVTIEGQNIKTIYVHELQRALRVCGLWDFAKNFKV